MSRDFGTGGHEWIRPQEQTIDDDKIRAILEQQSYPLATHNLDELHRELSQLERMLTPLLNQVRRMQGKPPMVAQESK